MWGQALRKIETIKTRPVDDFSLDVKLRKLHVAIVTVFTLSPDVEILSVFKAVFRKPIEGVNIVL